MGTERISLSSDAFVGKDRQTRSVEIGEASPELVMSGRRLVTGKELAEWLGVPYTWVREHTRKRCLDPISAFCPGPLRPLRPKFSSFGQLAPRASTGWREQPKGENVSHRSRYQKGYLYQRKFQGELWWYLRYYDVDGTRPDVRLAKASEYRTKKNVLPLVDELLRPFREGEVTISSATTLSQFWTNNYLPWLQGNRRPSTVWGYKQIWTGYLEMEAGSIRLRDFDLATSETLLAQFRSITTSTFSLCGISKMSCLEFSLGRGS